MKNSLQKTVIFPLALAFAGSVLANALADSIAAKVKEKTNLVAKSVKKTPLPGIYEVVVGKKIVYVDEKVNYAFVGHILSASGDKDLTEERLKELAKIPWNSLPFKDALKVTYGNGKRKVAVITDAKCTYCSLLEENLARVGNVTVYNFIAPVLNSKSVASSIICAKDPVKAWKDHMVKGVIPPRAEKCDTSRLDRNKALLQKLGFAGTPVLVFPDGSNNSGSMEVNALNARLTESNR